MRVSIQGYEGCFHQIVAQDYFGNNVEISSCDTFREVARQVKSGEVDFGVMAIENSIAGSIIPNYSILQSHQLQVSGEAYLRIEQNLMVLPGVKLEEIKEVHSHPMALLQCVDYLDNNKWKLIESEDTALSAKVIANNNIRNRAAIASRLAAKLYGLEIIAPAINSIQNNYTRFVIIKRYDHTIAPDANKASLYFKTDHNQGSFLKVLSSMEGSSVNLSKLQSYPIPNEPWHYLFHVDIEFECLYDYIQVLDKMQLVASDIHVYGVYKKGDWKLQ